MALSFLITELSLLVTMSLLKGERRRLSSEESDWRLASGMHSTTLTRTRGGGKGKPDLENTIRKRFVLTVPDSEDEDSEPEPEERTRGVDHQPLKTTVEAEDGEDDDTTIAPATTPSGALTKPTHTRVIVEVSQLASMIKDFMCPKCGHPVEMKLLTVCIATSIDLVCSNQQCFLSFQVPSSNNNKHS